MATTQRDLVIILKRETVLNLEMLCKVRPMSTDLTRQIFKENALEKPTQSLFNHLSHYLVFLIDIQAFNTLPWPLYDSKTEREYRNKVSAFISDYSSKGLLAPVMSSYLVNPSCYKVTVLMFQMSQLAIQRVLVTKMTTESQKNRYNMTTDKYQAHDQSFIEDVEKEISKMSRKLYVHARKREIAMKISELYRTRIIEVEEKLQAVNCQKYLDNLVDNFLKKHTVDDHTKSEILKIKNVNASSNFFDAWLSNTDATMSEMESKWDNKMGPFLDLAKNTRHHSEMLIARSTGEADKSTYMLEYNPNTDYICTKELQNQVNTQQKYILKNIVRDNTLSFPNLLRSYLIAIGFVLKNTEIDDEIYKFNEYLEGGSRNFKEIVLAMKSILERVMNAEDRLEPMQHYNHSISLTKEFTEIPPLPDLSDLKTSRDQSQVMFDTFTPLGLSKYQFNVHRRTNSMFAKPQPRSIIAPHYQGPRDDFLKSLISCRISGYDRPNSTMINTSVISQVRNNETIAECSSGFTKQQIQRLLSTKKSSSSKKFKYKTDRPNINIKKGGLFNESQSSNESNGLFRSYSSPNLFENREKRSRIGKKFPMMQDNCLLEVSGITALDKDSFGTPENVAQLESSRKLLDATSLPTIAISPPNTSAILKEDAVPNRVQFGDLNLVKVQENFLDENTKTETPKSNTHLIRKTSSLEKIINRFKKVRANVLPSENNDENEFRTIVEEKENMNTVNVDVCTANRILLPDLLSPSCSTIMRTSIDHLEQVFMDIDQVERRKPRESLGTALGVDQTFLDQFDLID